MCWPVPQTRDPPYEAAVILRPACGHNSIDLLLTGGPFAQSLVAENDVAQYACVLFRASLGKWRAGSKGVRGLGMITAPTWVAAGGSWDGKEALCWGSCGTSVITEMGMWLAQFGGEFPGGLQDIGFDTRQISTGVLEAGKV